MPKREKKIPQKKRKKNLEKYEFQNLTAKRAEGKG